MSNFILFAALHSWFVLLRSQKWNNEICHKFSRKHISESNRSRLLVLIVILQVKHHLVQGQKPNSLVDELATNYITKCLRRDLLLWTPSDKVANGNETHNSNTRKASFLNFDPVRHFPNYLFSLPLLSKGHNSEASCEVSNSLP